MRKIKTNYKNLPNFRNAKNLLQIKHIKLNIKQLDIAKTNINKVQGSFHKSIQIIVRWRDKNIKVF